ncbi:hypothetical protein HJG53_02235 [Sphingomonas sp. ID1715]|nr:hypothetical protein [Sphingomonas sp. ID1715]
MTLLVVTAFSVQLAAGRSTFASPWPVHLHAISFFGWIFFYLLQNALVATGSVALHRRLGWIAAFYVPALVAIGIGTVVRMVRHGTVPFFFTPAYFLVMDPATLLVFAGLVTAAIRLRRKSDWHRRLMLCGMCMLLGPAFGRLLPMPLLVPFAGLAAATPGLLFPLAGMIADRRRDGSVHPAWFWGVGVMLATFASMELIGRSPAAARLAEAVAANSPGASIPPSNYPPPSKGRLITGR